MDVIKGLGAVETNGTDSPLFTHKVVVTDCGAWEERGREGGRDKNKKKKEKNRKKMM